MQCCGYSSSLGRFGLHRWVDGFDSMRVKPCACDSDDGAFFGAVRRNASCMLSDSDISKTDINI